MPPWVSSLLFAVLVVTIPYVLMLKIMLGLPKPVALSHRRWPLGLNVAVIGAVTAYTTIFIQRVYYGRSSNSAALLMEFVIAALSYVFGLALILRQFAGVYPEYIVTTGWTGLSVRKTVYRNIVDIREARRTHGEAHLRIETSHGLVLPFTLPIRHLGTFYERMKPQL
jgi:hypothetical protein